MIDISLLRALSTRDGFNKLNKAIPKQALEPRTAVLIKDIERYYLVFESHDAIDYVQFRDIFKIWHKKLDADTLSFYDKMLSMAEKNLDPVSHSVIVNSLLELDYATKVAELLESYNAGEDIDLITAMADLQARTATTLERAIVDTWIKPDLDELILHEADDVGLTWRLPCMNAAWKPLQGGDSIIIAGRPGKGKTTFLTDQLAFMAPQLDERPILWCNNEGDGKRIVKRLMQSALNLPMSEIIKLHQAGKLREQYADTVGDYDRIRVIDIHGYWNYQVEKIVEQHKPKVLVLDMIDNIKFAGLSLSGGARTDQVLEEMYKWARELGVRYDCAILPTSQISNEGSGIAFPAEGMLKDSKTGKQGACDAILMIGHSDDPMLERSRFLGDPKGFKNAREGASTLRAEVFFDKDRGRYIESIVK